MRNNPLIVMKIQASKGWALAILILVVTQQAQAAEAVPGGSCAGITANSFTNAGGPENGGVSNLMFCNGGSALWTGVVNFQSTGRIGIGNTAPGSLLDIGKAGTTLGTLRLEGNTSGYVGLQSQAAAGSWTMSLPNSAGTSGYVLSTDGAGVTSWISNAGTASTALSGITAASVGHTIANANFAQVWNWDTLNTGTALTIGSTSMTTGSLLSLSNTNTTSSTGTVLKVNNSSTGATLGISSTIASTSTNGTAIKGKATAASGVTYGIWGETASTSGAAAGIYGIASAASGNNAGIQAQTNSTTDGADGLYALAAGATGATYGVYGVTASASDGAVGVFGVATNASGSNTTGVHAETNGTGGQAVEAFALATTGTSSGIYAQNNSPNGTAGYFRNDAGGTVGAFMGGNVGIGTDTPAGLLTTYDGDTTISLIAPDGDMESDGGSDGIFWFTHNGIAGGSMQFHWFDGTTQHPNLTIMNDGNILFAASAYLNFGATEGTTGYGFRDSGGTLQRKNSGGSWAAIAVVSDQRLKRDIVSLPKDDGLASIMKLRPVRFHWKDVEQDQTEGEQIGLIAQEVEKVYPTGDIAYNFGDVTMNLGNGKKEKIEHARGLNYEKIVPPLIKAIQEQQAEIEQLRAEIAALKTQPAK
jgi:hypothetical protein